MFFSPNHPELDHWFIRVKGETDRFYSGYDQGSKNPQFGPSPRHFRAFEYVKFEFEELDAMRVNGKAIPEIEIVHYRLDITSITASTVPLSRASDLSIKAEIAVRKMLKGKGGGAALGAKFRYLISHYWKGHRYVAKLPTYNHNIAKLLRIDDDFSDLLWQDRKQAQRDLRFINFSGPCLIRDDATLMEIKLLLDDHKDHPINIIDLDEL